MMKKLNKGMLAFEWLFLMFFKMYAFFKKITF